MDSGPGQRILREGDTCWRRVRAHRVAFLVDGSRYYPAVASSLSRAEHAAWILAWDIDRRLRLYRDGQERALPERLGPFLDALCRRRRSLHLHVLLWDYAMVYALEREPLPTLNLGWRTHRRLHFRLDGHHPVGACHHQKVVAVDDAVAFVGGFDLSKWRWDTPAHRPDDPVRRDPDGRPYPPFHDAAMVVDGPAATALGELARDRWARADGGQADPPPSPAGDPWPEGVEPVLREVPVAICRTDPGYGDGAPAREVAALYRAAIAAARHRIYIENQYFTANLVGEALARRLAEADGPEVVIVLPKAKDGWLERTTMDVLRSRLLQRLRAADRFGRLGVYYPHIPGLGPDCVSLHAKVLVVDDELVRVGSSNTSNRSMGLDTECDLALEAEGAPRIREAVAAFRNDLLAEHLATTRGEVAAALGRGSLTGAVEALRRAEGRSLRPLDGTVAPAVDRMVPDSAVIDPEQPVDPEKLIQAQVPPEDRASGRRRALAFAAFLLGLLALAAAWHWTPLSRLVDMDRLADWIATVRHSPWAFPVVALTFLVGSVLTVPLTLLIVATAVAFGPWLGFVYAYLAGLISVAVTYHLGRLLGRRAVRSLAGTRLNRVSRWLARRGLPAIITVRIVPVAPFIVTNMVAGAVNLPYHSFLLGSAIGMVPGTLAIIVFADRLLAAVLAPDPKSLAILAGVTAVIVAGALLLRRLLRKRVRRRRAGKRRG